MLWLVYRVCLVAVKYCPHLTFFVLSLGAIVKYFLCPSDIYYIVRNIRIVSRRKVPLIFAYFFGWRVLVNFIHYWVSVMLLASGDKSTINSMVVEVEGKDFLPKQKEGGIIATAHLGNWELAGCWIGENIFPIWAIAVPHKNDRINEFFDKMRAKHNVSVVPVGKTVKCIKLLKEKNLLAILGDWDFSDGKATVDVEFFGKRTLFPAGIGLFASRFNVPVIPLFCVREGLFKYKLKIYKPIYPDGKDSKRIFQEYVNVLEDILKKYIWQWMMFGKIGYAKEIVSIEDLCIVMPAYNEARHIGNVLEELKNRGANVIVVDDGSSDETAKIAGKYEFVSVHRLSCNEGKGVAIKEGISLAKREGFKWILLMDADGQHLPSDIDKFLSQVSSDVGMVCGNRMNNPEGMPLIRRFTNFVMSSIISLYVLRWIPDTQCGYRLIRSEAIDPEDLTGDRYEIETDLILRVRERGWEVRSVPIESVYRKEVSSYINPIRDTVRFIVFMFKDVLKRIWR